MYNYQICIFVEVTPHRAQKPGNYIKSYSLFKNKVSNKTCLQIGGKRKQREVDDFMRAMWEIYKYFVRY